MNSKINNPQNNTSQELVSELEQAAVREVLETEQGKNPQKMVYKRLGYLAYAGNKEALRILERDSREVPDAAVAYAQSTGSMEGVERLLKQGDSERAGDIYGGARRRGRAGDGYALFVTAAKTAKSIGKRDEMIDEALSWTPSNGDRMTLHAVLDELESDYQPTNDASLGFVVPERAATEIDRLTEKFTPTNSFEEVASAVSSNEAFHFGTERAAAYQAIAQTLVQN